MKPLFAEEFGRAFVMELKMLPDGWSLQGTVTLHTYMLSRRRRRRAQLGHPATPQVLQVAIHREAVVVAELGHDEVGLTSEKKTAAATSYTQEQLHECRSEGHGPQSM